MSRFSTVAFEKLESDLNEVEYERTIEPYSMACPRQHSNGGQLLYVEKAQVMSCGLLKARGARVERRTIATPLGRGRPIFLR
ncbi:MULTISPECIES: hypothetical protein [Ralstonia]|uniref:hypothetical protein n=1 Tax=Ralstonia TaxID=48736 RepID=UPI000AF0251A|nr:MULTISPECIES: hypothetical protein [Ralstonia]MBY4707086.1 hypothetical protein [Ralstonia insidiosa]